MTDWPYNTTAWKRLRAAKLARDPFCYAHWLRGRAVQANTVDHIKAIAAGGDPFPDFDGLMSLCASCHSIKTQAQDVRQASGFQRRFKGCDVHGNPVDPGDAWHGGAPRDGKRDHRKPRGETRKDLLSGKVLK